MLSPQRMVDEGIFVQKVQTGAFDVTRTEVTAWEKRFNDQTAMSASEWVFHHPDDEKFVPTDLPDPRPLTFGTSAAPREFDGERWFKQRTEQANSLRVAPFRATEIPGCRRSQAGSALVG
jgi:hypothetical protein